MQQLARSLKERSHYASPANPKADHRALLKSAQEVAAAVEFFSWHPEICRTWHSPITPPLLLQPVTRVVCYKTPPPSLPLHPLSPSIPSPTLHLFKPPTLSHHESANQTPPPAEKAYRHNNFDKRRPCKRARRARLLRPILHSSASASWTRRDARLASKTL